MYNLLMRRESGAVVLDGNQVNSTLQCKHCGKHEHIVIGSGTKRGHCFKCSGFICGKENCMSNCTPIEARIEYQEAKHFNNQNTLKRLLSQYPQLERIRL